MFNLLAVRGKIFSRLLNLLLKAIRHPRLFLLISLLLFETKMLISWGAEIA